MPLNLPHARLLTIAQWCTYAIPLACAISRFVADLLLVITAILFLVHVIALRQSDWLKASWVKVALVLWGYVILHSLFAEDVIGSLGRSLSWGRFPIFGAALVYWVLQDAKGFHRMIVSLSVALGFMLLDTALQYFTGHDIIGWPTIPEEGSPRLTGPFSAPRVGIMLIWMGIPVLAYWLMDTQGRTRKGKALLLGIAFAVGLLSVIFMSGERMALLLTGLSFVLAFFLLPISKWLMVGITVIAAVCMALLAYTNPGLVVRQLGSTSKVVGEFGESNYGLIWHSGMAMVADHPAFGVGLRQFRVLCPKAEYGPTDNIDARCNLHPHNIYLEWAIEAGLLGLSLFVGMVSLWVRVAIQELRELRCNPVFVGLFITLLIRLWPLATSTSFFTAWSAVPMWLMVGWLLAIIHHQRKAIAEREISA